MSKILDRLSTDVIQDIDDIISNIVYLELNKREDPMVTALTNILVIRSKCPKETLNDVEQFVEELKNKTVKIATEKAKTGDILDIINRWEQKGFLIENEFASYGLELMRVDFSPRIYFVPETFEYWDFLSKQFYSIYFDQKVDEDLFSSFVCEWTSLVDKERKKTKVVRLS